MRDFKNFVAILFCTTPILLISACGSGTTNAPAAPSSAAAQSANTVKRQYGSWKFVHTMVAFDGTGVEGGMAEMVKAGQSSIGNPTLADRYVLLKSKPRRTI